MKHLRIVKLVKVVKTVKVKNTPPYFQKFAKR